MSLHKEISFETEICQHLADHGWLYAEHPQGLGRGCKDAEDPEFAGYIQKLAASGQNA